MNAWHRLTLLTTLLLCLFVPVTNLRAATLVVNVLTDAADLSGGSGTCDSDPAAGDQCSLRAAIQTANTLPGADTITFDAAIFAGSKVINLSSQLPAITTQVSITGTGARNLTIRRDSVTLHRLFEVASGAVLTLTDMTLTNGFTLDTGGAVLNSGTLTVQRALLIGNTSENGGAIYSTGTLVVDASTFTQNTVLDVRGSSLYILSYSGSTTLTNTTISGDNNGWAIYNHAGEITLKSVTVADNALGFYHDGGGQLSTLTFQNVIFANQTNCSINLSIVEWVAVYWLGNACATQQTIVTAQQLRLGELRDNGGSTPTHALLTGSVAIDSGDNSLNNAANDQRGYNRVAGTQIDLGAYERQASPADAPALRTYSNDPTITLAWSGVTWATAYQVQIATSANFAAGTLAADNQVSDTAFTWYAPDNHTYFWRVRGRTAGGTWGAWSVAETFTVEA